MNTIEAIKKEYHAEHISLNRFLKKPYMMAQLGIPEGLKPLLCASFGYAVKEEPAKEHKISVNRV